MDRKTRTAKKWFLILIAAVLTCEGCGVFEHPPTQAQIEAKQQRWIARQMEQSKLRLLGEEKDPYLARRILFGVDITGEGFWLATGDVMWNAPINLYNRYFGNETATRYAADMESDLNPDAQRAAILKLSSYEWGRQGHYTTRYEQIASHHDADYLVRAAAIRALNRARDKSATALFIKCLDDPQFLVRLEAAKALANIPDPNAVQALTLHLHYQHFNDATDFQIEAVDVRIACADALRLFKTPQVAQTLVDALAERDFGVAAQARLSLIVMTGKDYRYDTSKWLTHFAGQSPFAG